MAITKITAFVCRSCRTTVASRQIATSVKCLANDPTSDLADLISPAKSSRSQPLRTPLGYSDTHNPFPATNRDDLPNNANPSQQTLRPLNSADSFQMLERTLGSSFKKGRNAQERNVSNSGIRAVERAAKGRKKDIESQMMRIWREGDVYAPHDLSPVEQTKARAARSQARGINLRPINSRRGGGKDVLDDLNINPIREYKNFAMMSEFVTDMGRIRHGRETGFRAVNQRKMAKAVKRAHGMGLLPSVHRHPELEQERKAERTQEFSHSAGGY